MLVSVDLEACNSLGVDVTSDECLDRNCLDNVKFILVLQVYYSGLV